MVWQVLLEEAPPLLESLGPRFFSMIAAGRIFADSPAGKLAGRVLPQLGEDAVNAAAALPAAIIGNAEASSPPGAPPPGCTINDVPPFQSRWLCPTTSVRGAGGNQLRVEGSSNRAATVDCKKFAPPNRPPDMLSREEVTACHLPYTKTSMGWGENPPPSPVPETQTQTGGQSRSPKFRQHVGYKKQGSNTKHQKGSFTSELGS